MRRGTCNEGQARMVIANPNTKADDGRRGVPSPEYVKLSGMMVLLALKRRVDRSQLGLSGGGFVGKPDRKVSD